MAKANASVPPHNRNAKFVRKPQPKGGVPRWLIVLVILGALLFAAHLYIVNRIERSVNFVSAMAAGMVDITHRGGYYTWDGDFGINKLRVETPDGSTGRLTIDKLELDTPGWGWSLGLLSPDIGLGKGRARQALGGGDAPVLLDADSLGLKMIGLEFDINSLLPAGMPSVSFASGSIFEAEGCTNARYWVPLNLTQDLGLPYQRVDLAIGYRTENSNTVVESYELDSPGLSRVRFERELTVANPASYLADGLATAKVKLHRWVLEDSGFLAARNRYCSEQSKIDEDEFLRRHLTAVRRVLQTFGVQPSPETEVLYADFVRKGGRLEIEARPTLELSPAVLASYEPAQIWEIYNAKLRHDDGSFQPMGVEFVPPRPLPDAYSGSVYDLIARNADTQDAPAVSPAAGIGDKLRALATKPPEETPAAEPAPPKVVQPPKPMPRARPQPVPIQLNTESLIAVIGERVQIKTNDGKAHVGVLSGVDPKVVSMKVKVVGGYAELSYARERLVSVEVNPDAR